MTDGHVLLAALFVGGVVIAYACLGLVQDPRNPSTVSVARRVVRGLARVALATVVGVPVGWCFYGLQYLIEGIEPMDVQYFFAFYSVFGGAIGFLVGVGWAVFGRPHVS